METVGCNLCGGLDFSPIYQNIPDEISGERFNIVECSNCGLWFTNPRPEPKEIHRYYSPTYYSYNKQREYLSARIALFIKKYYVAPPKNFLKVILYGIIAKLLKKYISVLIEGPGGGRKVLDVGCGDGRRVTWLLDYGFKVYGTDISENALRIARRNGLETFCGDLKEARYPSKFFDIIIFSQVFEHIHKPQETLVECYRILKDGGIIIIDVPNIESVLNKIYKKYWFPLEVPRHLYHFSKITLSRFLKDSGFTILYWKYRYPKFFDLATLKRIYKYGGIFLLIKSIFSSLKIASLYPFKRNRDLLYSQTVAVYARK